MNVPGWWWNGQLSGHLFPMFFGRNTRTLNENHSWWIWFYIDGPFLYLRFSLSRVRPMKIFRWKENRWKNWWKYRLWFCRTQACSKSCPFWLRCVFDWIFNLFCRFFTFQGSTILEIQKFWIKNFQGKVRNLRLDQKFNQKCENVEPWLAHNFEFFFPIISLTKISSPTVDSWNNSGNKNTLV